MVPSVPEFTFGYLEPPMPTGYPLLPAMDKDSVRRSPDPRMQPAFEFIEANLHRPIKLAELVALTGLSPARFSHLFTLATGITPGRYLRGLRPDRSGSRSSPHGPDFR